MSGGAKLFRFKGSSACRLLFLACCEHFVFWLCFKKPILLCLFLKRVAPFCYYMNSVVCSTKKPEPSEMAPTAYFLFQKSFRTNMCTGVFAALGLCSLLCLFRSRPFSTYLHDIIIRAFVHADGPRLRVSPPLPTIRIFKLYQTASASKVSRAVFISRADDDSSPILSQYTQQRETVGLSPSSNGLVTGGLLRGFRNY